MLGCVAHILRQIVLAERAFDLHKCGLKYGQGGRFCRTRSCESAGTLLDGGAAGPWVMPSLVHHLPSVQVCWGAVRTVGAPTPLQQGGTGGGAWSCCLGRWAGLLHGNSCFFLLC